MIYTIAGGTQKDIQVGDAIRCIPGVLPRSVEAGDFVFVAGTSASDSLQISVTPDGATAPVVTNLSPAAVLDAWRKQ
jgi:hypothetical protein